MKFVEIEKNGKKFEGILLKSSNPNYFVIKLKSGYNIGIKKEGAKIKVIKEIQESKQKPDNKEKGEYILLSCGGTICSKVEYKTGAVYPLSSAKEIYSNFPELKKMVKIETQTLFNLLSEDMTQQHWEIIANEVSKQIKKGKKGIILMHGTDTMHYTSAAISFAIQNPPIPIIFVGAQRSSDRPSSDNKINLLNAVYLAKKGINEVGIVMHANLNDRYVYFHKGVNVRKMHTSRRDAFKSINQNPIAKVNYEADELIFLSNYKKKNIETKIQCKFNKNVAMLYIYPGIKKDMIKPLYDYDGVLLVGTGLGHVPTNIMHEKNANSIVNEIKELIESDVKVAISSQTIYGRINMNVYSSGRKLRDIGVIGHNTNMVPETAFAKLCWILGHEKRYKKVKEIYESNLVGEITDSIII